MPKSQEPVKIEVMDDYQNVALSMADWSVLDGEATAHASRCGAVSRRRGPFKQTGIGPLNESAVVMADAERLISDRLAGLLGTDSKVAVQVAQTSAFGSSKKLAEAT
jgi:hypothetical protein